MTHSQKCNVGRSAFTLVELLVVIAIIAILLALSGVAYFRFTSVQMVHNTNAKIEAINKILQQRWDAVIAEAKAETVMSPMALKLANGDEKRARVIWIRARLAEAFPMSFAEITSPAVYAPNLINPGDEPLIPDRHKYNDSYKKAFVSYSAGNHQAKTESAACLWIALTSVVQGKAAKAEGLDNYARDTDGDGVNEFVDDWREPLQFFRFPTDYTELQNSAPAKGSKANQLRDTLDPDGTLVNPSWYTSALRPVYENVVRHKIYDAGSPPRVNFTIPVIVSSGGDNLPGLSAPSMAVSDVGQENDNIYSFKLQVGKGSGL